MDITYAHGEKVWWFAAVPVDKNADLDVKRLCVPGASNNVVRKSLADYIQMSDEQKIMDTIQSDSLAHFVVHAVWAVMAPVEPVPVMARWHVLGVGKQELFIPCGELPPDASLYTVDEWALEALMFGDWRDRCRAAQASTSERIHLIAVQDKHWLVRYAAIKTSTSERVHLLAMQDEELALRHAAAKKSTSKLVHTLALQDEDWSVRYAAKNQRSKAN